MTTTIANFRVLYRLADKYHIPSIKAMILKQLKKMLSPANAAEIAILGYLHNEDTLLEAALKVLKDDISEVRNTPAFRVIEERYPAILTKIIVSSMDK